MLEGTLAPRRASTRTSPRGVHPHRPFKMTPKAPVDVLLVELHPCKFAELQCDVRRN